MQCYINRDTWRLLAITESDFYIPILTSVFGEAKMGGRPPWSPITVSHRSSTVCLADLDVLANRC